MRSSVPDLRISKLNRQLPRSDGAYVLYWMVAYRRVRWNFALDRALEWAVELHRPLVILEALRCDYPWASDRLHRFVLDGMRVNGELLRGKPVSYIPYVEPEVGAGKGLLQKLWSRACVVVTDDLPAFFLPRMARAAAEKADVAFEAVDSVGLVPMRATEAVFPTAYAFRRFLQKNLPAHFLARPKADPFRGVKFPALRIPEEILKEFPSAVERPLEEHPISHRIPPVSYPGGSGAAGETWRRFLKNRLIRYPEDRNEPEKEGASGLSPYLHFGHISVHEIFHDLIGREGWTPDSIAAKANGSKEGWWGLSPPAEAFLDELVTWRELGFNFCSKRHDYDHLNSLPDWAKATLHKHVADRRPHLYSLSRFEGASTHDPLWNAAQVQLVREGRIHNYLRMLWGKKILEWTQTPQEALEVMVELNNKYAVDGRDPNSYSGIFWVLGRYDRPWAPERPIFGRVRYMSSENTARKFRVKGYIEKYRV
jgi:deoxyribodipyrimidine photo-lyase